MSDWINAEYDFGMKMKGVFLPYMWLKMRGVKIFDLFHPISNSEVLVKTEPLIHLLPADAKLVRVNLPNNQDGVIMYFISEEFSPCKESCLIEIIHLQELIDGKKEKKDG